MIISFSKYNISLGDHTRMVTDQGPTSKEPKLPIQIREYNSADEEQVNKINQESLEISFRFYYEIFHKTEPDLFLVAEYEDEIIGFTLVKDGENFGEAPTAIIYAIAVSPSYRSQGIGTQLVNAIANVLHQRQIKKLFLHVRVGNKKAIKFYQNTGFTEIQKIKEFYSWGEDALRMVLLID